MHSAHATRIRAALILGMAAALIGGLLSNRAMAQTEEWSESITPGLSTQNEFVMVFSGDQTGNIPTQTAASYDNPFSSPTINVAYNAGMNQTTVTFSGSNSISSSSAVQVGLSNLAEGTMGNEVGAYWENTSDSSTAEAEILDISSSSPTSGSSYVVVYIDFDRLPSPTWWVEPVNPADVPPIFVLADDPNSVSFVDAGFMFSNTEIPLDDLNLSLEPPPGDAGSMFIPLPDPAPLNPGGSEDISLPEPGSLMLLAIGAALLLVFARAAQRPNLQAR
jgi:hypothetical protein